jgi:putative CocE/NonD family hydrolase
MAESQVLASSIESDVDMRWGIRIPLRDDTHLSATLYLPRNHPTPSPVIFTLTPYIAQTYHDQGMYFASHGYPFVTVDVRGRGNSEGIFKSNINEAKDGHDVVEWLAQEPYCNGQVAMWGGSYAGHNQWFTAKEFPPHLATIVPVASPYLGVDYPTRNNIFSPFLIHWLTLVSGRTSQDRIYWNNLPFWSARFRRLFESGAPFNQLDALIGNPSATFQEWLKHPQPDAYWDNHNPTSQQYAQLCIPILTITGIYDDCQPGSLMHHREHLKNATIECRTRHYLIIGPWDHTGTRTPKAEFGGLKVEPAGLLDLPKLHLQWYEWTMRGGPKPAFLQKNVAYYVMGAEKWRYTDTLEAVTVRSEPLFLHATGNPVDVFQAGALTSESPVQSGPDRFIYDPRDVRHAELESTVDPESRTDQRMIYAAGDKQLIYHSDSFDEDVEVSGFFKFSGWISIDQPDTDIRVSIYEIDLNGNSILLTYDSIRARYRESLREGRLIRTTEVLRYDFERFTFVSRLVKSGSRLRVVIGPINSIYSQKNYNSGGVVSEESMKDARPVTVKLFHDPSHPSALHVPLGQVAT